MSAPTHDELVARAVRWLGGTKNCYPVIGERICASVSESPDAIGWKGIGSFLVECKTCVSDFYSDRRKIFRRLPEKGMGKFRYFLVPPGLIDPSRLTIPDGWGLLECLPKIIRVKREATGQIYNMAAEIQFLRDPDRFEGFRRWCCDRLNSETEPDAADAPLFETAQT